MDWFDILAFANLILQITVGCNFFSVINNIMIMVMETQEKKVMMSIQVCFKNPRTLLKFNIGLATNDYSLNIIITV